MPNENSDREGRKPYKTYKARRPRRTSLDERLTDERVAAPGPSRGRGAKAPADHAPPGGRAGTAYRTYGPGEDEKSYRTYGAKGAKAAGKNGGKPAPTPRPRRRRFRWWYVPVGLFAALVIAGVVLVVLAWPGYQKFDRAVDKANRRVDAKTKAQLTPDDGWIWRNGTTILLLGADMRATDTVGRSDTILLMHFDPSTHTINQLSIPRDTKVDVAGHGSTKINEAMFWGGPALAVKTVKEFTGIPINHVMVVSFQGFPRLVNAVGGIDMYVPRTVTTEAGSTHRIVTFKKGTHHFDGKYAMLYVRIRKAYADGDFTRARRQQAFVQALEKKIVQPSNITKLPEIGRKFMSGVATDLTTNQILELAYLKWRSDGGKKIVMVGTPGYDGGVAYVFPPDAVQRQKIVRRFLNE